MQALFTLLEEQLRLCFGQGVAESRRTARLPRIGRRLRPYRAVVSPGRAVSACDASGSRSAKDASKKAIRRQLRQLFQKYKLPLTGEPLESAWAYILKHY